MPNIATLLKQEIQRLARKEVKTQTEITRRASAQHRRDIAELKRQVADLSRQVEYFKRREKEQLQETPSPKAAQGRRFSQRGLVTHRAKLGLSAHDYGLLVGVSGQTIYNWEQGRARPRAQQLAALVSVRQLGKRDAEKRLALLDD